MLNKQYLKQIYNISFFQEKLLTYSKKLKVQERKLNLDNILQEEINCPIITCLKGLDYKENHAVAIYKNWIYDGNFDTAQPLSKESLDECCSTMDKKCSFVSFLNTYIIPQFDAYLEKNSCLHSTRNKKKNK